VRPSLWILLAVVLAPGTTAPFSRSEAAGSLSVLSAGAVEEGVRQLSKRFTDATGHAVTAQFGTGPAIEERLASGAASDVLIAPVGVLDRATKGGRIVASTARPVARVGVGVAVRRGANAPDASSVDALRTALLHADAVIYNRASTGQYLESLFQRMGILDELEPKTTRYASAAQVLEHLIAGGGNEIGFGPVTEIKSFEPRGVVLVAPLPSDVQNFTTYVAAVMSGSESRETAEEFVQFLTSAPAREVFAATGAR
jgi:molybdate transport system substrate-binding protein